MARGGWGVLTGAAMSCTVVLGTLLPRSSAAVTAPDFWPLVKCASRGVWGTLLDIQVEAEDRLLVIAVAEQAFPEVARGDSVLRLLEHHGQLPEGTPLRPGDSGLFLFSDQVVDSPFLETNGTFVPAGLLRLSLASSARGAVTTLVSGLPRTGSERGLAFGLLESQETACRALAIGWLAHEPTDFLESEKDRLRNAFAHELSPRLQGAFLELFLLKDLDLADGGASRILLREESTELLETSIRYLERFSGVEDRARLLQAFANSEPERQPLLLETYARISLHEAWVWWETTLAQGDAKALSAAVEFAGVGGFRGSLAWYDALLASSDPGTQKIGIEGLATLRTPESIQRLRRYCLESPPSAPLSVFAQKLLKHPYRYGKPPRN